MIAKSGVKMEPNAIQDKKKSWKGLLDKNLSLFVSKLKGYLKIVREIIYGMTIHEMDLEFKRERGSLDHLFMLVVFGDLVGLPLLPPYYSMRLLPYIIPSLQTWKRSLLRERDVTDFVSVDI
jgi:hypothetical protein